MKNEYFVMFYNDDESRAFPMMDEDLKIIRFEQLIDAVSAAKKESNNYLICEILIRS